MSNLANLTSAELLNEDSPLLSHIQGFAPRAAQQQLATAIESAINNASVLVAEAGTGTGKTYAYLIPALLANKKVIISTGTKNLQDQLFNRDLPIIRKALGLPAKTALLKGRSNYICLYFLEKSAHDRLFHTRAAIDQFNTVRSTVKRTEKGEISEFSTIPEDAEIWPYVTSTADNCLGQECEFFNDCYLVKARRKALEADIVVVNHHLFFADLNLKTDKLGELLPQVHAIILDEAHQLPEIASQYFGRNLSSRQFMELVRDIELEQLTDAKDSPELTQAAKQLEKAVKDLRLSFGDSGQRAPWQRVATNSNIQQAIESVTQALTDTQPLLLAAAERGKGLENCYRRFTEIQAHFALLTQIQTSNVIHWYETFTHSFILHHTPLTIADEFQPHLQAENRSWIFTSATLAVHDNFSHFTEQMGLQEAETLCVASPFDYQQQALLYVPRYMPDPNHHSYTQAVVNAAIPLIEACRGRTFFLFTSHQAMKQAAQLLADKIQFPLLIQGQVTKDKLLKEFCRLGNAVLLGTNSFWEGVDVRGHLLSCVIIDRLPFGVPDDPVFLARVNALKQRGQEPFNDYQLPQAVIALKQGAGRLIRDIQDRGVLMVADPRLVNRDFGQTFLNSLPPMQRTREQDNAVAFLTAIPNGTEDEAISI